MLRCELRKVGRTQVGLLPVRRNQLQGHRYIRKNKLAPRQDDSEGAVAGLAVLAAPSPALAAIKNVDCTKGETITTALTDAVPGDTIRVTGTCRERITITSDRLTLDGQGRTILDEEEVRRLSSQGW